MTVEYKQKHQPEQVLSMEMRRALDKLGSALCFVAVTFCAVLNLATFITTVPLIWIVPPFLLLATAVVCARAARTQMRSAISKDMLALLGWGLLIYALCTFLYFYKTTGGATSVGIVDGQYVARYKDQVLRTITQKEYEMFPNLWSRVMSAWIGMMAVFCARFFSLPRILQVTE